MIVKVLLDVTFENERNQPVGRVRTFRDRTLRGALQAVKQWGIHNRDILLNLQTGAEDLEPLIGEQQGNIGINLFCYCEHGLQRGECDICEATEDQLTFMAFTELMSRRKRRVYRPGLQWDRIPQPIRPGSRPCPFPGSKAR